MGFVLLDGGGGGLQYVVIVVDVSIQRFDADGDLPEPGIFDAAQDVGPGVGLVRGVEIFQPLQIGGFRLEEPVAQGQVPGGPG